jgi:hypothetical protein
MALPASGPISGSQIGTELSISAPYSLHTMSLLAGFSTPDAMSEFYGYVAPVSIYINVIVPSVMTCGQYYTFCAYVSGGTTVNTTVQAQITWNGDLGGSVYGTVNINSGNNCGSNVNVYSGYGVNCGGENYASSYPAVSPTSYGSQNYFINYVTTDGVEVCPC